MKENWVVYQSLLTKDEMNVSYVSILGICTTKELAKELIHKCLMLCKEKAWSSGFIPEIIEDAYSYQIRGYMGGIIRNTPVGTIMIEADLVDVAESPTDFKVRFL